MSELLHEVVPPCRGLTMKLRAARSAQLSVPAYSFLCGRGADIEAVLRTPPTIVRHKPWSRKANCTQPHRNPDRRLHASLTLSHHRSSATIRAPTVFAMRFT